MASRVLIGFALIKHGLAVVFKPIALERAVRSALAIYIQHLIHLAGHIRFFLSSV